LISHSEGSIRAESFPKMDVEDDILALEGGSDRRLKKIL
jgi:hypothetical protein